MCLVTSSAQCYSSFDETSRAVKEVSFPETSSRLTTLLSLLIMCAIRYEKKRDDLGQC